MFRHTKESLQNVLDNDETKKTVIADRFDQYEDPENDDKDNLKNKLIKDKVKDNADYIKFKAINKIHFRFAEYIN